MEEDKHHEPLSPLTKSAATTIITQYSILANLNGYRKKTSFSSFDMAIRLRFRSCKLDPESSRPSFSIFSSNGLTSVTSMSGGRNPRSFASREMRESKSPCSRFSIARVMFDRSDLVTCAIRPKSRRQSVGVIPSTLDIVT